MTCYLVRMLRLQLAMLLLATAQPALAIDPGTASGAYADERLAAPLALTHAIAVRIDDAEGLSLSGPGVRVLLSDREVPPEALYGASFPPVWEMARSGAVRGLLLSFNDKEQESLLVTVLDVPEPGFGLATITFSDSSGLWTRLSDTPTRVTGELKPRDDMRFSFSAPVFHDKVVATLTGAAATESEFTRLFVAQLEAFARKDYDAVRALKTKAGAAAFEPPPAEFEKEAAAMIKEQLAVARSPTKIVVRGHTAVMLLPEGVSVGFARENGAWKLAN